MGRKATDLQDSAHRMSTVTRANPGQPGDAKLQVCANASHSLQMAEPPQRLMVAESLDALTNHLGGAFNEDA